MPGMIDVQCPACRKRFGFSGDPKDRPPCPRCGFRPSPESIAEDQAHMEDFRKLLASRPGAEVCQRQRVAAGLTLRQAAKILGFEPHYLSDLENGRLPINEGMAAKMAGAYGLDPNGAEHP